MVAENKNQTTPTISNTPEITNQGLRFDDNPIITDNVTFPVTNHKLNGNNYLHWSKSVRMFISGKGKAKYLTGEFGNPKPEDPGYQRLDIENNMVKSWLINSMTVEIGEDFLLYETAHDIWEAARESYSTKDNISAIFEIESTIFDVRQGNLTVTQYYHALTRLWQQLDTTEEPSWTNPTDRQTYKQLIENKRII